jgi:hypothetical protein
MDGLREVWLFFIVVISFLLAGFILITHINYSLQSMQLRATLDGKEIYHGPAACIETISVGSSSRVDIKKGPWCLFPKQYFVGKNLIITTEDHHGD